MTFGESRVPPPERERERESYSLLPSKAHTLEHQDHDSSHQAEDLGYMRPPWVQGYNSQHVHRACAQELHGRYDSFPIGVSADSCPLNGPWQWCHLIRVQLVSLDCGP